MRYQILILALLAVTLPGTTARAEMPSNVKCAIQAQEKARNKGSGYQEVYDRNFEICILDLLMLAG